MYQTMIPILTSHNICLHTMLSLILFRLYRINKKTILTVYGITYKHISQGDDNDHVDQEEEKDDFLRR